MYFIYISQNIDHYIEYTSFKTFEKHIAIICNSIMRLKLCRIHDFDFFFLTVGKSFVLLIH